MDIRLGEDSVLPTSIDITVTPAPFRQFCHDGDENSHSQPASLAAESNILTGPSDPFSTVNLTDQVVDDTHLASDDEIHSHSATAAGAGGRRPISSSNSTTSTTTLLDDYMPPAPTPPQTRQRESTVQSQAVSAHVSSPVGNINTSLEAFESEDSGPQAGRGALTTQDLDSDDFWDSITLAQDPEISTIVNDQDNQDPFLPPHLNHLLSTLQSRLSYLTPPHLHPKLHHLLDPTAMIEQLHTQAFEPAIFSIRLAEILLQVCAPRRDELIVEIVGESCASFGKGGDEDGGDMIVGVLRQWWAMVEVMREDVYECRRKIIEAAAAIGPSEEEEPPDEES